MNKRKEEIFESVPKWADLYEVSHDTVKMRSCAGPFSPLTNSHMILGPPICTFRCKKCMSIYDEGDVIGDRKCPSCGYGG
jgi:hypothetical protein